MARLQGALNVFIEQQIQMKDSCGGQIGGNNIGFRSTIFAACEAGHLDWCHRTLTDSIYEKKKKKTKSKTTTGSNLRTTSNQEKVMAYMLNQQTTTATSAAETAAAAAREEGRPTVDEEISRSSTLSKATLFGTKIENGRDSTLSTFSIISQETSEATKEEEQQEQREEHDDAKTTTLNIEEQSPTNLHYQGVRNTHMFDDSDR